MLKKFNKQFLPAPMGLHNPGVLCYFNSLIQCLLSCTSFNELLCELKTENTLVENFVKIYKDSDSCKLSTGQDLLASLIKSRLTRKNNLSHGMQEDMQEGLLLLLDSMANKNIEKLFYVRYDCNIRCLKCKKTFKPGDEKYKEPPEIMVDIPAKDVKGNPIDSAETMQNYILHNVQIPDGYKCVCGAKNAVENGKYKVNIIQEYRLKRLSEIIIVLFKKYKNKEQRYFPAELEFPSKEGLLKYKIVAQAEHYGNNYGGHYLARCLRSNLVQQAMLLEKIAKTENMINMLSFSAIDSQNLPALQNELKTLKIKLQLSVSTYELNDSSISAATFAPTINTYMVFYHIYSSKKKSE